MRTNVSRPTETGFLYTLRQLIRCTQAFERYSGAHVRQMGLTESQFDVIATLGNTPGMSCKALGEKTLITKGTLTGVLDRMEARALGSAARPIAMTRAAHVWRSPPQGDAAIRGSVPGPSATPAAGLWPTG